MSAPNDPNELSRRIVTKIERNATELPRAKSGKVRGIRSNDLKQLLEDSLRPERDRFKAEEERYQQNLRELEEQLEKVRAQSAETRRRELPRLAQLVETERTRVESLRGELEGMERKLRTQESELEESQRVRRHTERHSASLVRELQELREASSARQNEETSNHTEELLLALDARLAELEHRTQGGVTDFEATQQIDMRERNARLAEQAERVRALEDSVWEALEGATPSGQVRRRVREERRAAADDPEQARVLLLRELVRQHQAQEETLEGIQLTLQNYEARLMSLEHRQRSDPQDGGLHSRMVDLEGRNSEDGAWLDHLERRLQSLEQGSAPAPTGQSRAVAQRTDAALASLEALLARSRGIDPGSVPPARSFPAEPAAEASPSRAPSRAYARPARRQPPAPLFPAEPPAGARGPSRLYPLPADGNLATPGPPPPRSFSADPAGVPPPSGAYRLPENDGLASKLLDDDPSPSLDSTSRLASSLVASLRKQEEIKELLREALYQESPELALANGESLVDGGYSADIQPPFSEIRERAIRACEEGIELLQGEGKPSEAQGIRDLLAWLHSTPQHGHE